MKRKDGYEDEGAERRRSSGSQQRDSGTVDANGLRSSELPQLQVRAGNRATSALVQRKKTNQEGASVRSGQKLDRATRATMESAFDTDLGHVRIHTDGEAAQKTSSADAHAVTEGSDIYFASKSYGGASPLLAHEVAHVLQQTGAQESNEVHTRSDDVMRDEREADRVSEQAATGRFSGLRNLVSVGRSVLTPRACAKEPSRQDVGEIATRADQVVRLAAAGAEGETKRKLQEAARATGWARRNISRANDIADIAELGSTVYEAVVELERLQGDDGTFGDGAAAARQFDILFTALGGLLEKTNIPGVSQYGALLKNVGNFFENTSRDLDPRRRDHGGGAAGSEERRLREEVMGQR